jgi:putative membrane protein
MVDVRLSRGLALGAWAAFFTLLWVTGDADRYLGARTTWVVPFGAILTGATALVLLARGRSGVALSRGEAWGTLVLVAPILAVLTIPHAELGAAAAERRATASPAVAKRVARSAPPVTTGSARGPISELSYAHVMAAQGPVPQPGVVPGVRVRLVGFVMRRPGTPPGLFQVTRFFLTCCIADAMPLYVSVDPPGAVPKRDTWVVVTGPLARRGEELIVAAEKVSPISPPTHPYLGPSGPVDVPPVRHGTRPPDPTQR